MEQLELQAAPRAVTGKKVKQLRNEGLIPGVLYGHGVDSISLKFDAREIEQLAAQAGSSSLIKVNVEGSKQPYTTIIRDVQRDSIKRNVTHIDLQALSMKEKVRLNISLTLIGASPAVESLGGVLIQQMTEVEAECLPTDLVPTIEVDINGLTEIGSSLFVEDLNVPQGLEILTDPKEMIVQVTEIAEEAAVEAVEEALLEAPAEAGEVEVITKSKSEEEEAEN